MKCARVAVFTTTHFIIVYARDTPLTYENQKSVIKSRGVRIFFWKSWSQMNSKKVVKNKVLGLPNTDYV